MLIADHTMCSIIVSKIIERASFARSIIFDSTGMLYMNELRGIQPMATRDIRL